MTYNLGDWNLESPFLASCSGASRIEDLAENQQSALGGTIIKSVALDERAGNPEPNYWTDGLVHVNAQGLPGPGMEKAARMLEEFDKIRNRSKLLILGVVAMKPEERDELFREAWKLQERGVIDGVEDNLSCPNIPGKPIVSYDREAMRELGLKVMRDFPKMKYGIKLAPFYTKNGLDYLAEEIEEHFNESADTEGWTATFDNKEDFDWDELCNIYYQTWNDLREAGLSFISATNTLPNLKIVRADRMTVLNAKSNGGKGGLSGYFLQNNATSTVDLVKVCLPGFPIIGTGGVIDAKSAQKMFRAGASAVGMASVMMQNGAKGAQRVIEDFAREGY